MNCPHCYIHKNSIL